MSYKIGQTFEKFDNDAHVWARENDATVVFNKENMHFEIVAVEIPIEVKLASIQKKMTDLVQLVLDSKAQELLYDSCLSVCSYIDTGVPKFDAEGRAFRAWRSAVWAKGYEILAQVQAGQRPIPSEEQLIAELPQLVINY